MYVGMFVYICAGPMSSYVMLEIFERTSASSLCRSETHRHLLVRSLLLCADQCTYLIIAAVLAVGSLFLSLSLLAVRVCPTELLDGWVDSSLCRRRLAVSAPVPRLCYVGSACGVLLSKSADCNERVSPGSRNGARLLYAVRRRM